MTPRDKPGDLRVVQDLPSGAGEQASDCGSAVMKWGARR